MIRRTYYTVLGIPRDESLPGIRAAYRDRARRLHPDVAGAGSTPAFREVTEAFEVLSDPERRLAYDGTLDEEAGGLARGRTVVARTPLRREPITVIGEPDGIRPSFEALRDRFERNFTGVAVPKSERAEALALQVVLTPAEARRGCLVPILVPAHQRCPHCAGDGFVWGRACSTCGATGWLAGQRPVVVHVPALTPSGTVFEVGLEPLGIRNLRLCLHVFVSP